MSNAPGRLFVVATPIGNLDDITLRAIEVLRSVDRVLAEDTRHTRRLLRHLGIDRPLWSLHEHNEAEMTDRALGELAAGRSMALVSDAGTPLISDPGFPLVRACREQGLMVVPIPGPSALLAALSVSGLPTDRFRFEGFLPRKSAARHATLRTLAHETATMVFYESSHRVLDCLADMLAVFGGDRPAVLARELTKRFETIRAGTLADLHDWVTGDDDQRRGEFVLLLGGARDAAVQTLIRTDELLHVLLEELPVKRAAAVASRITGEKKNALYQQALKIGRT